MIEITVVKKEAGERWYGQGSELRYRPSKPTALVRGTTYTFLVDAKGHPFHLSTDEKGGPDGALTAITPFPGVEDGILKFTPNLSTPSILYAVCGRHPYMTLVFPVRDKKSIRSGGVMVSLQDLKQFFKRKKIAKNEHDTKKAKDINRKGGVTKDDDKPGLWLEFNKNIKGIKDIRVPNQYLSRFGIWYRGLEDDPNKESLSLEVPFKIQQQIAYWTPRIVSFLEQQSRKRKGKKEKATFEINKTKKRPTRELMELLFYLDFQFKKEDHQLLKAIKFEGGYPRDEQITKGTGGADVFDYLLKAVVVVGQSKLLPNRDTMHVYYYPNFIQHAYFLYNNFHNDDNEKDLQSRFMDMIERILQEQKEINPRLKYMLPLDDVEVMQYTKKKENAKILVTNARGYCAYLKFRNLWSFIRNKFNANDLFVLIVSLSIHSTASITRRVLKEWITGNNFIVIPREFRYKTKKLISWLQERWAELTPDMDEDDDELNFTFAAPKASTMCELSSADMVNRLAGIWNGRDRDKVGPKITYPSMKSLLQKLITYDVYTYNWDFANRRFKLLQKATIKGEQKHEYLIQRDFEKQVVQKAAEKAQQTKREDTENVNLAIEIVAKSRGDSNPMVSIYRYNINPVRIPISQEMDEEITRMRRFMMDVPDTIVDDGERHTDALNRLVQNL